VTHRCTPLARLGAARSAGDPTGDDKAPPTVPRRAGMRREQAETIAPAILQLPATGVAQTASPTGRGPRRRRRRDAGEAGGAGAWLVPRFIRP